MTVWIDMFGAKHGDGTTTVAALTALGTGLLGSTVVVGDEDLPVTLGVEGFGEVPTLEGELTAAFTPPVETDADVVVVDWGVQVPPRVGDHASYMVVRPSAVSLARARQVARSAYDAVVTVAMPGCELGPRDVEDALGKPVAVALDWSPGIARAADAGALARLGGKAREVAETLTRLLDGVTEEPA